MPDNIRIPIIAQLQAEIHKEAVNHGWWDEPRSPAECLMLVVTELAEAMEAYRNENPMSEKIAPFSQMEEELADAIIRIFDLAGHSGFEMGKCIEAKMRHNETRPYRHGGKIA